MPMPRNVWLLIAAQALNQCCAPMIVLVGGLVGALLAPVPQLVTLPCGWVLSGLGRQNLLLLYVPIVCVQLFPLLLWRRGVPG